MSQEIQMHEAELKSLLQQADAGSPSSAALDATTILAIARGRTRRKRVAVAGTLVVAAALVAFANHASRQTDQRVVRFVPQSDVAPPVDVAVLQKNIDSVVMRTGELVARLESLHAEVESGDADNSRSRIESLREAIELERQQQEIAELESTSTVDPELEWQLQWARSGAIRLELARLNRTLNPEASRKQYEALACTYAGTPTGDAARQAVSQLPTLPMDY